MATRLTSAAGRAAIQAVSIPRLGRHVRTPRHDFHIRFRPFQLAPCALVPVIPGDTMKAAMVQMTALTDPIKNPLIGWWLECFMFYVPFRAMDTITAHLQTMALDPAFGELNAAADIAAASQYYHGTATRPSFAAHALQSVVEEFFMEDGETYGDGDRTIGGLPQIGITNHRAIGSVVLDATATEPDRIPGEFDEDGELGDELGTGATDFAGAYDAWQAMVAAKFTDVTYEDFLRSYGVRVPTKPTDEPAPELLRYMKWWKRPSRAVDETDGSIAAAVNWAVNFRADKDRRFKEPGFILVVTAAHPKIYFANQVGAVADYLTRSLDWMPKLLQSEPYTNIKLFADGVPDGPLGATMSGDYQMDMRDLFAHGDQFLNFALTETDAHLVALPNAAGKTRMVSTTDIDAFFAAASPANQIRADGVASFTIAGSLQDMTP